MTGQKGSEDLSVTVEPGTSIILPILGLHMDPKHFPEPERYDPERFLDKENKNKYVYMPFGEGPRVCLGQRFGLLQIKVGIIHIIRNFQVTVSKKMQVPIKYSPFYILLYPKNGFHLNFHEV
ncbi:hypothetical protein NQ318_015333 [Aromia moschata]|uniref:Cytochrome P450 n=1 Tax=Aromia moschata TaxID=1265417 RepID=A0AAV8X9S0_9CUCU|nr:hypothetical protein NQ318_015333 [Aromia moschata]